MKHAKAEQEAFQSELRAWLDRNAVEVFDDYGAAQFSCERRGTVAEKCPIRAGLWRAM